MKLAVMNKLSDPKGPMTEVSLASVIWCTSTTSSQKFRVVLWLGMIHWLVPLCGDHDSKHSRLHDCGFVINQGIWDIQARHTHVLPWLMWSHALFTKIGTNPWGTLAPKRVHWPTSSIAANSACRLQRQNSGRPGVLQEFNRNFIKVQLHPTAIHGFFGYRVI